MGLIDEAIRANLDDMAQKISGVYALKVTGDPEVDKVCPYSLTNDIFATQRS